MRRNLIFLVLLIFLVGSASAYWQTRDSGYNNPPSGAPSYTGPGDVVSGAIGAWSCSRAYNAAYATANSPMCILVDTATGLASCTLKAASSGGADVTTTYCVGNTVSITTFCTVTHAACSVSEMYDQSGGLACGGAACNLTQATLANMPGFSLSCAGSKPCITTASQWVTIGTATSHAQPVTASFYFESTGAALGNAFASSTGGMQIGGDTTSMCFIYGGGAVITATCSAATYHAVQAVMSTTVPDIYVDGTGGCGGTCGNPGATGIATDYWIGAYSAGNNACTCNIAEVTAYSFAFSSGQKSSMNSNQTSWY